MSNPTADQLKAWLKRGGVEVIQSKLGVLIPTNPLNEIQESLMRDYYDIYFFGANEE